METLKLFSLLLGFLSSSVAIDNGLGLLPPMGWRSWNIYHSNIDQDKMQDVMDAMVDKSRSVDGIPTSLSDLGYTDVGLDDNWQDCSGKHGSKGYSFHNDLGLPVINRQRFPNMLSMTDYAHSKGLTIGWYFNNCICKDKCSDKSCYIGDVAAFYNYNFDSVKLDGCSAQTDLDIWADTFNATGKPVLIENCHWGGTTPTIDYCPWNFFRTSIDIRPVYNSIMRNLLTTQHWAEIGLSKPGCWAYPDMLEVGNNMKEEQGGLTDEEIHTHFAAWSIVSSPLILSFDITNKDIMDKIWPVISNREVIAVNQAYFGHSGSIFYHSENEFVLNYDVTPDFSELKGRNIVEELYVNDADYLASNNNNDDNNKKKILAASTGANPIFDNKLPKILYYYKPLSDDGEKVAVLLINNNNNNGDSKSGISLTLQFNTIPTLEQYTGDGQGCVVRDIWGGKDLGTFAQSYTATNVTSHKSVFLHITCYL